MTDEMMNVRALVEKYAIPAFWQVAKSCVLVRKARVDR